jgi:hypothetical protein
MVNDDIYSLLKQGEILEVEKALNEIVLTQEWQLVLKELIAIFREEVEGNVSRSVFDYSTDIDELTKHFNKTKLLLRRMDFDVPWEYMEEFYEYCEDMGVSVYMLSHMVKINMYNKEKVCDGLVRLYMEKKGAMSTQAQYFLKLKEECEGK